MHNEHDHDLIDEGPSAEDIARFSHATLQCPNCATEVYDEAAVCPTCLHHLSDWPSSRRRKLWISLTMIILATIGFFLLMI
ncbi:MAG: hypothetical protein ACYTF7_01175 [Planctomycetota bacterium]|jgi:uncharacterized paraquat-inducible protein A